MPKRPHRVKPRVPCTCLQCGKGFEVLPSIVDHGGGKYCSRACTWKHKTAWRQPHTCEQCKRTFTPKSRPGPTYKARFCGTACFRQHEIDAGTGGYPRACLHCGKVFRAYSNQTCSPACARGYGLTQRRALWERHLQTLALKNIRRAFKQRDKF